MEETRLLLWKIMDKNGFRKTGKGGPTLQAFSNQHNETICLLTTNRWQSFEIFVKLEQIPHSGEYYKVIQLLSTVLARLNPPDSTKTDLLEAGEYFNRDLAIRAVRARAAEISERQLTTFLDAQEPIEEN